MIDCDDLRAWSYDDMVSDRNGCYIQDRYIVIGQEIVPHMDILSVITIEPGEHDWVLSYASEKFPDGFLACRIICRIGFIENLAHFYGMKLSCVHFGISEIIRKPCFQFFKFSHIILSLISYYL